MKAELNENGELRITAESGLEAYALMKWGEDYFSNCQYTERPHIGAVLLTNTSPENFDF